MTTSNSMVATARAAELAWALQQRMTTWPGDTDPGWHIDTELPKTHKMTDADRRRAVRLFLKRIGDIPTLPELAQGIGPMALLDRRALLARLCALALLGRPGVLRCCVQREARLALQAALGPAYAALRERAMGAAVVPADVAAWSPLNWAWVGWRELLIARAWPHPSLRRLARVMLPAARVGAPRLSHVPAPCTPLPQRLAEVEALFRRPAP